MAAISDELKWSQECRYISDTTDKFILARKAGKRPNVHEMNDSEETFLGYCLMQQRMAEREGFDDTVQYIQHCLDDLEGAKE